MNGWEAVLITTPGRPPQMAWMKDNRVAFVNLADPQDVNQWYARWRGAQKDD